MWIRSFGPISDYVLWPEVTKHAAFYSVPYTFACRNAIDYGPPQFEVAANWTFSHVKLTSMSMEVIQHRLLCVGVFSLFEPIPNDDLKWRKPTRNLGVFASEETQHTYNHSFINSNHWINYWKLNNEREHCNNKKYPNGLTEQTNRLLFTI